ncbi:DUF4062 domain-containing protein [Psychrobium sp. MM17-31]|uniref:DUF4062 domain-containing protein n=1 Tax=Psychrobium sp. MM17-31 TaxID=2917758 RepID=UPI001EF535B9|nr:DUF4062 domain-containing protein [Psychrobium sp. MM17-31]MCG7530148.1 DUF4062 domain-containing protein [Psychrobium sp. MM17-31]
MAKPRIFISSTYYDLKHIRNSIERFVSDLGYESVLFESGDIPFDHQDPLDESCYKEIETCHIFVLIIGGRYGSSVSNEENSLPEDELEKHYHHFNSITRKEYETAKKLDLPIYIFVDKGVSAEYQTYKENRENTSIKYAHVDSVNIFKLLDSIHLQRRNNLVREFEKFDDISSWLREQWSGLFAKYLSNRSSESNLKSLARQLGNLEDVASALKDYSENLLINVSPQNSEQLISETNEKLKHKKELSIFESYRFIKHLINDHGADPEKLFDVFVVSKTLTQFKNKANEMLPEGKTCGAFISPKVRFELEDLREELDLNEWKRMPRRKTPNK